jgi:hypothetical protein
MFDGLGGVKPSLSITGVLWVIYQKTFHDTNLNVLVDAVLVGLAPC